MCAEKKICEWILGVGTVCVGIMFMEECVEHRDDITWIDNQCRNIF
jgi:hypothetical protein